MQRFNSKKAVGLSSLTAFFVARFTFGTRDAVEM